MRRIGAVTVLSLGCVLGMSGLALGQGGGDGADGWAVDKQANGQPAQASIDPAAVARLEEAEKIFAEDGREREAITAALAVLPSFENGNDYNHLVDCLFLLGEAYYYLGEWASAEKYMQRASDLGYRYFADQMSSYPLKVIGESQFEQKKFDQALATFQERVQKLRKESDVSELGGALFDVGGMLINLGREEEALAILAEALDANNKRAAELSKSGSGATDEERTGNAADHAEITYHLAIGNFRLEQYAEAKKYLEQAYSFFNSIQQGGTLDVADRLVAVLDDLVVVNEQLGNTADADKYRRERDKHNQ